MSKYSRLERATLSAYRTLASVNQALPQDRKHYSQWEMAVTAVEDLKPCVRRVTLTAPEFADYQPLGADEYFGLIMPQPGQDLTMPADDRINIRASIQKMPEAQRPDIRWYTVRNHRRQDCTIDVDIVTHGTSGPGSTWALAAQPGDHVGFRMGSGSYQPPGEGVRHLLIADETAVPAVAAIADSLRGDQAACDRVRAVVEVSDDDHMPPLDAPFDVEILTRGDGAPGSLIVDHIVDTVTRAPDYAWACGESRIATETRRHLVKTLGMKRRSVMFSGYWKEGQARL